MSLIHQIATYSCIIPIIVGLFIYGRADYKIRAVFWLLVYELLRQLSLKHILTGYTAWTTHIDAIVIPSLLVVAITPDALPYEVNRKRFIAGVITLLVGLTVIEYFTDPRPEAFNVLPFTIASGIISLLCILNIAYLTYNSTITRKKEPMHVITIGCLIYFLPGVYFFSQTENVLDWSNDWLFLFMIINKALYVFAFMACVTVGFNRLRT